MARSARPSPLCSTSMPTEPVIEPLPVSWSLSSGRWSTCSSTRCPFGLAVFDLEGRLQRWNRTWVGFYQLYSVQAPSTASPAGTSPNSSGGTTRAIEDLLGAVNAGHVVRQAAHKIGSRAPPPTGTSWFAPLYEDGQPSACSTWSPTPPTGSGRRSVSRPGSVRPRALPPDDSSRAATREHWNKSVRNPAHDRRHGVSLSRGADREVSRSSRRCPTRRSAPATRRIRAMYLTLGVPETTAEEVETDNATTRSSCPMPSPIPSCAARTPSGHSPHRLGGRVLLPLVSGRSLRGAPRPSAGRHPLRRSRCRLPARHGRPRALRHPERGLVRRAA